MPCNISLDSPILDQQSVREMLNLPLEEKIAKVSLEDLMQVALKLIKSELVDCGYGEDELHTLRIAYTAKSSVNQENQEDYVLEWRSGSQQVNLEPQEAVTSLPDNAIESKEGQEEMDQSLPISPAFLRQAAFRVNEAIGTSFPDRIEKSRLSWRFNREPELSSTEYRDCTVPDPKCDLGNGIKKVTIKNKADGSYVRCEDNRFCPQQEEERFLPDDRLS
jgi:hypothetical protein